MSVLLKVENLNKSYPDSTFQLQDVSFSIPYGSIVGFIGDNGAGKSTTMGAIIGNLHRNSGSIVMEGLEIDGDHLALKKDVGVVFDTMKLPTSLTIRKLSKVLKHIYKEWDQPLFNEYITMFSLPENQKIGKFSRGMSMKLSMAVALSHNPKLLILDEATAGLDPSGRHDVLDILSKFVKDKTRSVLLSSHITSDIEKIADYLMFIKNGEIILNVSKDKLLNEFAVIECMKEEFEKIEPVAFRKKNELYEVFISDQQVDASTMKRKKFSIDDITLLLMRGERK
jgi:ABC-2 type transport system ATP-binding protein